MVASPCPSLRDLADPDRRRSFQAHIDGCARCRTLVEEVDTAAEEPLDHAPDFVVGLYTRSTAAEPIRDVDAGVVVAASVGDRDEELVCALLDLTSDDAIAVPLSHEVTSATAWDLLLPETTVGYSAMLEVWNHGT